MSSQKLPSAGMALGVVVCAMALYVGSAQAASAPGVKNEPTLNVSITTAVVETQVDPVGLDTTLQVEYGTDKSYGSIAPVLAIDVGNAGQYESVKVELTGLRPGTMYHYRVVATNSAGSARGLDKTFTTFEEPVEPGADSCPNATFRVGFSRGLPDCRAYEMVSPVEKNGADVLADEADDFVAAESGDRIVYLSHTGFGDTGGSGDLGLTQYMAERGPSGWRSKAITPTPSTEDGLQLAVGVTYLDEFSSDLSIGGVIGYDLPNSPPGVAPHTENLYLENLPERRLVTTLTDDRNEGEPVNVGETELTAIMGGASASMDVVTFQSRRNLAPGANGTEFKVYAFENGTVKLLGILPKGTIPPGGSVLTQVDKTHKLAGFPFETGAIEFKDAVSTDGSRILFEVPEDPGQIFMRKNGSTTVLVSESETGSPVTAANVTLMDASPDLKHIVFSTSTRLLNSAPGGGLYMYIDSPSPESESNLTYIGPGGPVLGMSEDGSRVYVENEREIYLWDDGSIRKIAPEPGVPQVLGHAESAQASADGRKIAFVHPAELTRAALINIPGNDSKKGEMYVYDEDSNSLTCVSCPRTGAVATEGVSLEVSATDSGFQVPMSAIPHFFSRDGRYVFFNTEEALVPQDTNGMMDAYEYDTATGQLSLLSTGAGELPAWFVEASADGRDAFITTSQQLNRWDPDSLNDLYDARAGGGLPEPPPVPAQCAGDACQGTPSAAPSFNTASGFLGLGNQTFSAPVSHKAKLRSSRQLQQALTRCLHKPRRKRVSCRRTALRRYQTGKSAAHPRRAGR